TLTQTPLPATLLFDHPTPTQLTTYIHTQLTTADETDLVLESLDTLETALRSVPDDTETRDLVAKRLRALLDRWTESGDPVTDRGHEDIASASAEDVMAFIDQELGRARD
ncbi:MULTISPECIES: acyl carrier protein, partial [unclassified Streptomyces]|uniref:acyl carrier protein n=1 Tax=unclassified Streptomyces TaxID=2593676 RepID=UPI0037AB55B4